MTEVLVISISKPLLIGVYEDKKLVKVYEDDGMTSDVLPIIFEKILKEFNLDCICYVNTPGSYMSIKVSYVFLKTVCITQNLEFKACSGFEFNENSPIKALGKKYFINEKDGVKVDFLENNSKIHDFKLPEHLNNIDFKTETLPIYNLPAV